MRQYDTVWVTKNRPPEDENRCGEAISNLSRQCKRPVDRFFKMVRRGGNGRAALVFRLCNWHCAKNRVDEKRDGVMAYIYEEITQSEYESERDRLKGARRERTLRAVG